MNITRMGHYHIPGAEGSRGTCQAAQVVHVVEEDATRARVNLIVYEQDAESDRRLDVQQDDPIAGTARGEATFHLSGECPWQR